MLNIDQYGAMPLGLLLGSLALLVIGLSTDGEDLASSSHCQPYDLPFFDDLPRGFFTTRIP